MKQILSAFLMILTALAVAQNRAAPGSANISPAEIEIAEARESIHEKPALHTGYNQLATALVLRARETSDASYYVQAEEAVKKSLQLAPNDFDTEKIQVSILLGEHEYPAALEAAQTLNKRVPDDVMVYGLLTDANVELGNYSDAENAAQWMLNLRPGNLPALTRAGHLRELFGDAEGAYDLMDLAYQSVSPAEAEERAWLLTQMGHLRFASGNTEAAARLLQQVLTAFPGYPYAVGNLAQVRIAQKRYQDAVVLLQQRNQSVPGPAGNVYELADALQLAGRDAEAKKVFAEFENKALLELGEKENSNRELVSYYADYAQQPAKALKVAQQEIVWRHDVYTLDAYAWALHVNGQDAEARKQIETALAVGIHDARLFRHAGEIALKTGDIAAAEHYLKQSGELNAVDSEQARLILASLSQAGR